MKARQIVILLLALALTSAMAACGRVSNEFMVDKELYRLDRWEHCPDYDSDSTDGYALIFLSTTDELPVSYQAGTNAPEVQLIPELTLDADTLLPLSVDAAYDKDGGGNYQCTISYCFALPKGAELPVAGVLHDKRNGQDFELDLSSLPVLEVQAEAEEAEEQAE